DAEKCGLLLHTLGRPGDALPYFKLCDEMRPGDAQAMFLLGRCLLDLKRFDEGLPLCLNAYKLDQGDADICNVLGVALQGLGQHERALWFLDKAVEVRKDFTGALNNRAISLAYLRRQRDDLSSVDLKLQLSPENLKPLLNSAPYLVDVVSIPEAYKVHD